MYSRQETNRHYTIHSQFGTNPRLLGSVVYSHKHCDPIAIVQLAGSNKKVEITTSDYFNPLQALSDFKAGLHQIASR